MSDSDDDVPLAARAAPKKVAPVAPAAPAAPVAAFVIPARRCLWG
jgi:hypothetical protein